jgi:FixJ family two-component response regulator
VVEDCIGPLGAEAVGGSLAATSGAVVRDPEDVSCGLVGLLAHNFADEAIHRCDAILRLATTEDLGVVDVPSSQVGPGTPTKVLVFYSRGTVRRGRQSRLFPAAGLNACLFVGGNNTLVSAQGSAFPDAMVQVQDRRGLGAKIGITRKNPASMLHGKLWRLERVWAPTRIWARPSGSPFPCLARLEMNAEREVVYVLDDDPGIREALDSLIRSIGLDVRTFASAQEFLRSQRADAPECLVLDVRLPGLSGLEVQRELGEAGIHIPIVFLTGHGDIPMTVQAMKAGAIEFLSKPFREQDLLDAIQQAIGRDRILRQEKAKDSELRGRFELLTPREREVMQCVVKGLLNKQMAAELGTSEVTVKLQRRQVMRKMRAACVADLVRMAAKLGAPAQSING